MRDYLFRGKPTYSSRNWVYGSLIRSGTYCCILTEDDGTDYEYPYLDHDLGTIDGQATPVKPETVGRFTGRKDKNGKMIFEDDVVKTKYGRLCVVEWFSSPSHCGWDLSPLNTVQNCVHTKAPDSYDIWKSENLEVVGNMHDDYVQIFV